MSSSFTRVQAPSTALILYDPTLPHISLKSHLDAVISEIFRRSLESTKTESNHLSPLMQKWKEKVVIGIARGISHLYIDEELGDRMARLITQNLQTGNYECYTDPFEFKEAILHDLKSIYPDKHLRIFCSEQAMPECHPNRGLQILPLNELTVEQRAYLESLDRDRLDFSKEVTAYIIPNTNIGYFKINVFPPTEYPETRTIIDEAMKSVVNADSLIIDLRDNFGGSPETVAFLASYLFDHRQLLNQLYQRSNNELTSFHTEPGKLDQHFGGHKPVYVLTSGRTFSAGEELAYDLQSSKRAKVIGQSTGGGAHPVRMFVVDDHIYAVIPFKKAVNPHTGTNWEGTGVLPDYPLPEGTDALTYARTQLLGQR